MESTIATTSKRVQTPTAILFSDFDITAIIPVHCAQCSNSARPWAHSSQRSRQITRSGYVGIRSCPSCRNWPPQVEARPSKCVLCDRELWAREEINVGQIRLIWHPDEDREWRTCGRVNQIALSFVALSFAPRARVVIALALACGHALSAEPRDSPQLRLEHQLFAAPAA